MKNETSPLNSRKSYDIKQYNKDMRHDHTTSRSIFFVIYTEINNQVQMYIAIEYSLGRGIDMIIRVHHYKKQQLENMEHVCRQYTSMPRVWINT